MRLAAAQPGHASPPAQVEAAAAAAAAAAALPNCRRTRLGGGQGGTGCIQAASVEGSGAPLLRLPGGGAAQGACLLIQPPGLDDPQATAGVVMSVSQDSRPHGRAWP